MLLKDKHVNNNAGHLLAAFIYYYTLLFIQFTQKHTQICWSNFKHLSLSL